MPDDFASTMQELSTAATLAQEQKSKNDFASLLREFRLVSESVQSLESALTRRVENIASIILPAHATELKTASEERKSERLKRWQENLANAIHGLVEVFHRLEVTEVESKEFVDLAIHRVVTYEATKRKEDDGRIVNRVKRGFIWRGNVLRPEEVVALRCQ